MPEHPLEEPLEERAFGPLVENEETPETVEFPGFSDGGGASGYEPFETISRNPRLTCEYACSTCPGGVFRELRSPSCFPLLPLVYGCAVSFL